MPQFPLPMQNSVPPARRPPGSPPLLYFRYKSAPQISAMVSTPTRHALYFLQFIFLSSCPFYITCMIYALLCLSSQILCTGQLTKVPDCFFIKTCYFFIWTFYYQKGGHPNGCNQEILALAVEIGDAPLRNGAEVTASRTRSCIFLRHTKLKNYDVYVLSNGIFASANEDREDACSMIRHIPLGTTHLGRIAALNQLSREICSHECSLIDAWNRLERCKKYFVR